MYPASWYVSRSGDDPSVGRKREAKRGQLAVNWQDGEQLFAVDADAAPRHRRHRLNATPRDVQHTDPKASAGWGRPEKDRAAAVSRELRAGAPTRFHRVLRGRVVMRALVASRGARLERGDQR